MKTWTKAACLTLCAGLLVSGVAAGLGDPRDEAKKITDAAKKQADDILKAAQPPAGMDDPLAQMKEASKPVAQHDIIKGFAGNWDADVKFWMGAPEPVASKGTMKATLLHGDRYLLGEYTGEFGGKFTGTLLWAYNRVDERYESSWCDSISSSILNLVGKPSADGKSVESTGTFRMAGPDGKPMEVTHREKTTMVSKDNYKLEMWHSTKEMGEMKVMEINYTRSAAAKPAAPGIAPGGAGITMPPATR
jgi:hypothetical protein